MSIELTMKRGEEAVAATIDVRDDVTLTQAYDATDAALFQLTNSGAIRMAPRAAPVIDWDSAPEGFPVWIEDVVPFGESASCWAKDAGSYYLGVNGSKWNKPGDAIFCAHYPTPSRMAVDFPPYIVSADPAMSAELLEQFRKSMRGEGEQGHRIVLMEPAPEAFRRHYLCEPFQAPQIDWQQAPEGATHALMKHLMGSIVWLKVGTGREPAYRWSDDVGGWLSAYADSAQALGSEYIVARPAPAEKWSLDGKDGNWNYDTLAELIRDNYGHGGDEGGFPALGNGLFEGDKIYRGVACFDDPGDFVPDHDEVIQHMADRAGDSEASEYADNYPDVNDEARAALELALEPLKAWARKHCQPDFFTVAGITPYILTTEDVQAAKAQERVK